ncbi:beta-ketoacyl synthase [Halobacteriovorax marinus]|uniref:beta-ketoacyl-[acyl-carrier-protein] synthase family protein n=1 Tax=Halobacteriovorax marinus TaxID=97084 RepID=UPI000BC35450|nr:beta-ketoacyl-[acyl-carrier-protein] synthase family protein [Halobacteriovorax marinus]ATH07667.1 beta-ketoacyl synthase [Halobacteriovorax marinus]
MKHRIVITGVGLTAPNGNNINEFRNALLEGKSGITHTEIRHMGIRAAGLCDFDEAKYQSKKTRKRGTRVGAISIYCANEAIVDAKLDWENIDKDRVGVYLGITEHGNVETENEIHDLYQNDLNTEFWSHHHNPRTVANNPAGEVTLNLNITGPHYTIGAACAAGNLGIIQAAQMLQLEEVDIALAGGVSESPQTFGIFAAFAAQGALGEHEDPTLATRPLDVDRNGIVISEGGAIYTLERLEDAKARGAEIIAEIVGFHSNSDASDFVLPNTQRQIQCMNRAIEKAGLEVSDIDIVSLHATGTKMGDIQECEAVSQVFGYSDNTYVNCAKGFIGHAMGAAGALELAGNLPSFKDGFIHPCKKIENIDPKCNLKNLVNGEKVQKEVNYILNNSFGMLGINSSLIVKKYIH